MMLARGALSRGLRILSFAVVAGLVLGVTAMLGVWAIRSMLPQSDAEPAWPSSVESVTVGTRPAWLAPGAVRTVQLVIELHTEDDDAVRLAIDYAIRVEDPDGEAEQIEVKIRDINGEQTFTIPLPLNEAQVDEALG